MQHTKILNLECNGKVNRFSMCMPIVKTPILAAYNFLLDIISLLVSPPLINIINKDQIKNHLKTSKRFMPRIMHKIASKARN